ncbi:MAG: small multi-drug export protein [Candidatus Brocadiia bacterium]
MSDETVLEQQSGEEPGPFRRIMSRPESGPLLAGFGLLVAYLAMIGLTRIWSARLFHSLWQMTVTHVFGGRAAGLSYGYKEELDFWLVVVANIAIEAFMVMLFYPLFVFSYEKLIVIKPLEDTLARARRVAEARQATVMKWGVPGLLLFVWFPFWMTGPLVGSIIGFLIGLRMWVNLGVVLVGTSIATICWGLVLDRVDHFLRRIGPALPMVFVGLILLIAVSIHIRHAVTRAPRQRKTGDGEQNINGEGG